MPFSRSQNSKTAKKSAFIHFQPLPYKGNKKVGRLSSSDFGALATQPSVPLSKLKIRFLQNTVNPQIPQILLHFNGLFSKLAA